ncbi:MAG: hypothetical protein OEP52_05645 [Acidimicrobiia bacterium]|nr:hypothetical protein [Acidimicrobiia bacterium]
MPVNSERRRRYVAAAVLVLVAGACGSSSTVDRESLGLMIEADIQAGSRFEVSVPMQPDTAIEVVSAPAGVTASISEAADGGALLLSVAVDADTPRGAYNLGLLATQDGEEHLIGWPFDVVDAGSTATTQPGSVVGLLTLDTPQVDELFPSPSILSGAAPTPTVDYRLTAGGWVLAEGTIDVIDGEFSAVVEFTNSCCVDMTLEVFNDGGLSLTIPVAYPEAG